MQLKCENHSIKSQQLDSFAILANKPQLQTYKVDACAPEAHWSQPETIVETAARCVPSRHPERMW